MEFSPARTLTQTTVCPNEDDREKQLSPPSTCHVSNETQEYGQNQPSQPLTCDVLNENQENGLKKLSQPSPCKVSDENQESGQNQTLQPLTCDVSISNQESGKNQPCQSLTCDVSIENEESGQNQPSQPLTCDVSIENEESGQNQPSQPLTCDVCDDDEDNTATCSCTDCNKYMCPQCRRYHGKFHTSHQVQTLAVTSQSPPENFGLDLEDRIVGQVSVVEAALMQMADDKRRLQQEGQVAADTISNRADQVRALVSQAAERSQRALAEVVGVKDAELGEEMATARTRYSKLWQLVVRRRGAAHSNIRQQDVQDALLSDHDLVHYEQRSRKGQQAKLLTHRIDDCANDLHSVVHAYLGAVCDSSQTEDTSKSTFVSRHAEDVERDISDSALRPDVIEIMSELAQLRHALVTLQEQGAKLQTLVDTLGADVKDLKGNNAILQLDIQTARDDFCKPLQDIVTLHREYNAFQQYFLALKEDNSAVRRDMSAINVEIVKLQKDCQTLQVQNENVQQELLLARGDNSKLQQDVVALKGENNSIHQDIYRFKEGSSSRLQEIAEIKNNVAIFEQDIKKMQDDYSSLLQNASVLERDNARLEQGVLTIREDSHLLQQDVLIMKGEIRELHEQAARTEEENLELRNDVTGIKGENYKCQQDVAALKGDNAQLHENVLKVTKETENMLQNVLILTSDNAKLQADFIQVVETITTIKARCGVQAAFHARLGADKAGKYRGTLALDDVRANSGASYDPRTGVFTAPVTGVYLFLATICRDVGTGDAVLSLEVDGTLLTVSRSHVGQLQEGVSCTAHAALRLSAGQKVWLRVWSDTGLLKYRTTFTGVLVQVEI